MIDFDNMKFRSDNCVIRVTTFNGLAILKIQ